jgi:uncharacterized protein YnzC (UPF0291/DUF896 family)
MITKILKMVEQFSKKYYKDELTKFGYEDQKLRDNYVQLVRKYALQLADIEGVDSFIIVSANTTATCFQPAAVAS